MKTRSLALYGSIALNALLVALLLIPGQDSRYAFGEVSASQGALAAASSQISSSRDAFWLADRVSGTLVVYDYPPTVGDVPLERVERRNLREDLQQRALGPLMIVPMRTSSTRSVVMVIDTDSERMAVYSYDVSNRVINAVQRNDLRVDFGTAPELPIDAPAPPQGRRR